MSYPDLDGVVRVEDIAQKGGGKFAADYVNWAKIAFYLRKHAPGWQPYALPTLDGGIAHAAPDGTCYLMIGFAHEEHGKTTLVPHAVMDHTMRAKKTPDARDISDSYVRGLCKAAALLFGLGWQLWSKDDPMERDLSADTKVARHTEAKAKKAAPKKPKPEPEVLEAFPLKEHALAALGKCTTKEEMRKWGLQVKVSSLVGQDLADLREAGSEHLAKITDGGKA
tara:strand:+ start:379 stop:1050 length:672 start_codon:yes stop_codon:yes gene_type:complete